MRKLSIEQPDLLDCFETVPELIAFYYRKYGPEMLRDILQQTRLAGEKLESYAAEFDKIGLSKLAALVRAAST
jgi:hypothetical protein